MDNSFLYSKLNSLPDELKKEVNDFIDFLLSKNQEPKKQQAKKEKPKKEGPKFGFAKGMFEMSNDFNEPLDDFKDYMH